MIRLANTYDAEQLYLLNQEFNGKNVTTLDVLKERLSANTGEIVIVTEKDSKLIGFVCAQVFKSFCYSKIYAEITEVFVAKEYRRQGYATQMIEFVEDFCRQNHNVNNFQLFTNHVNIGAQKLYKSLGYRKDNAILFRKLSK